MSLLGCTGPHEARLPMGMDLVGRPFGEPLLWDAPQVAAVQLPLAVVLW